MNIEAKYYGFNSEISFDLKEENDKIYHIMMNEIRTHIEEYPGIYHLTAKLMADGISFYYKNEHVGNIKPAYPNKESIIKVQTKFYGRIKF